MTHFIMSNCHSLHAPRSSLQVPYVIKESAIGGIGIFATEFIPKGALLWR